MTNRQTETSELKSCLEILKYKKKLNNEKMLLTINSDWQPCHLFPLQNPNASERLGAFLRNVKPMNHTFINAY